MQAISLFRADNYLSEAAVRDGHFERASDYVSAAVLRFDADLGAFLVRVTMQSTGEIAETGLFVRYEDALDQFKAYKAGMLGHRPADCNPVSH